MNKALHHPDTIKVRLRNQNKRRTPNATKVPDRPQLGSTTDELETEQQEGIQSSEEYNQVVSELASQSGVSEEEVKQGLECGITIENFNDIKEEDIIEAYEIVEIRK